MKHPRRTFDFSLLPLMEYQGLLIKLDDDVEAGLARLSTLQETHDRARAALMFVYQVREKDEAWRNDARLRAGLNELYSMQDAAARGFKLAPASPSAPKLAESHNPLIHLMYILRHVNVHTTPLPSTVEQITVTFRPNTAPEEMTYGEVVLSQLTISDLLRSNEIKQYYERADLQAATDWLMNAQRAFGISEVFSKGISAYGRELLAAYPE